MLGETVQHLLAEDEITVDPDLEHAPARSDELGFVTVSILDGVRQTGGRGQVVSNLAVLDGDAHDGSLRHYGPA